jgi:hypothetical protein
MLVYFRHSEALKAGLAAPLPPDGLIVDDITVSRVDEAGEPVWEFVIEEHQLGNDRHTRVCVYDANFVVYKERANFFRFLAGGPMTLDQIQKWLDWNRFQNVSAQP